MSSPDAFLRAYERLNKRQKEAVDTIEGPVMVIAGPGTGKTSVLTLRIANILRKTDTPANGILALTFTESAVHSMRKKLTEYIGVQAYRVHLYTFHGFAQEIITRYPEYFPRIIGGAVASESERFSILEEALEDGTFEIIRPFGKPFLYVRKALGVIQDLKRDTITPQAFKKLLRDEKKGLEKSPAVHERGRMKGEFTKEHLEAVRNNTKNLELAELYDAYERALRARNLYDFEDMLIEFVHALKTHKDLLRSLQEEYLYILADEHQDANNAQNAVLELLSDYADTRNLFIVGDEKQAIYRFQGASLENFLYFKKKFPDARSVFLDENYRSTQTILDASHSLMGQYGNTGDIVRPRLRAASPTKQFERALRLVSFDREESECSGVAEDIAHALKSGMPARELAVLVRTNAEIAPMGSALAAQGIPYTLFADSDVLDDHDIQKLMILLRAVVAPENDTLVGEMLFIDFLKVHPMDAVRLNRLATLGRVSPLEILSRKGSQRELVDEETARGIVDRFKVWMKYAHNQNASDAFLSIVSESRFQEHLLASPEPLPKLEKLARLYEEIKTFLVAHKSAKLTDFVAMIDTLLRHGAGLRFSQKSFTGDAVAVLTAHKSKGLEWRRVYLLHVADRVWGNRRSVGGFRLPPPFSSLGENEREEDERRLFYVALTRAKEFVTLSYARTDANGKDRLPSRFIEEFPEGVLNREEGVSVPPEEHMRHALFVREKEAGSPWDKRFLQELFLEQGMNATALNNYLECPWKYFFRNLVRLPDVPGKYLQFGQAVHAALKVCSDARREAKSVTVEDFLASFETALARLPLSQSDYEAALKKGKEMLPIYFENRMSHARTNVLTEYDITGVFLPLSDGTKLLLRGRLDKLEFLSDREVNVVDYKTGSHKTRNEILGKTASSNGAIKRQLDFYRLLLELHDNGKYEMISADIDFVEPDKRGMLRPPEHFEMSHADAERTSELVKRAADEIRSLSFWNTRCGEKECEFCALRELLVELRV